jgi:hypothetical protein
LGSAVILVHGKRHPRELGPAEVESFLTDLAVRGRVSPSTQNPARSAILFLYREVINAELPWLGGVVGARTPRRLPVLLTVDEVQALLGRMRGTSGLIVKDIDFGRREIVVRDGKGGKCYA